MHITLKLTAQQYNYVRECVATGLNIISPWPERERQEKEMVDLFHLRITKYGSYTEYEVDDDE